MAGGVMGAMQFYTVGYYGHEDQSWCTLTHERLFSQSEFDALVVDCIPEAVGRYEAERHHGKTETDIWATWTMQYRWSDLWTYVVDVLCERNGFDIVRETASFHLFDSQLLSGDGEQDYHPCSSDSDGDRGRYEAALGAVESVSTVRAPTDEEQREALMKRWGA